MEKGEKEEGKNFGKNSKSAWKIFLIIFITSLIVLNWSDIYWVFNPKVALEGIKVVLKGEEEIAYYDRENAIEISAIEINAPIIIPDGTSDRDFEIALNKGVVYFPGSAEPGKEGVAIFLGHSAPAGWPKINYDWVFSELDQLKEGDKIDLYFENRKYTYSVIEKVFLEIGESVPLYSSDDSEIILLSCWPPGKNIKRIGIRGILTQ